MQQLAVGGCHYAALQPGIPQGRPRSRCAATTCRSTSTPSGHIIPAQQVPQEITGQVSLYAISDLHTDYKQNLAWVQNLESRLGSSDGSMNVLAVAGDVSDDLGVLRTTLQALTDKFDAVAFVPGNHELWVKGGQSSPAAMQRNGGATDSIEKLHAVLELCAELDVITQPTQIGGLCLAPLLSWHHKSFDKEAEIVGIPRASAMTIADYAACKWPDWVPGAGQLGSAETAAWFDIANQGQLQQPGWSRLAQVMQHRQATGTPDLVTFSHFLPYQHLLPEKRMLTYPNLAKAVGSDFLGARLQQLQPDMHVFGHSHFAWDLQVEGIRCVQAPLCYPSERLHRLKSVILNNTPVFSGGSSSDSSNGSSDSSSSNGHKHHQPHPLHVGLQDHYASHVQWLPVKVYEATYTAQLQRQQGSSSTGPDSSRMMQHGLSILHSSQLQHKGQQLQACSEATTATGLQNSSSSSSSSSLLYSISSWQGSWCSNLGGMWSEYYKGNARQPHNTELAPWVVKRYRQYKRLAGRLKGVGTTNNGASAD